VGIQIDHLASQNPFYGTLNTRQERIHPTGSKSKIALLVTQQGFVPALKDQAVRRFQNRDMALFLKTQTISPEKEYSDIGGAVDQAKFAHSPGKMSAQV
jgi:hypothetical protein